MELLGCMYQKLSEALPKNNLQVKYLEIKRYTAKLHYIAAMESSSFLNSDLIARVVEFCI